MKEAKKSCHQQAYSERMAEGCLCEHVRVHVRACGHTLMCEYVRADISMWDRSAIADDFLNWPSLLRQGLPLTCIEFIGLTRVGGK